MELKEFKEKFQSKIIDAIANSGSFTLSNSLTDGDIHATKEDVEELLSLVNEYIEDYEKPKFKVGDYVTIYDDFNDEKYITKINEVLENPEVYSMETLVNYEGIGEKTLQKAFDFAINYKQEKLF